MSDPDILVEIPLEAKGQRVDRTLADIFSEYTRSTIQGWIQAGFVRREGQPVKSKLKLSGGEMLVIQIPERNTLENQPENIRLDVVYQDDQIIVLNKPAGMVVHPGAGNTSGTLLNALLYHYPELAQLPRGGIVHRLDKDTTGLMVVSRTDYTRQHLILQLENRAMKRQYLAIAEGVMIAGETIDQPVGRHRHNRLRMAVSTTGKPATTHLQVLEKFKMHTLLQANLKTGRTHQIRVHLGWKNYPIVGDSLYGCRNKVPPAAADNLIKCLQGFKRQALHACKLSLTHPVTERTLSWECALPDDFQQLLNLLRNDMKDQ